jgi:Acyltransferase
MRFSIDCTYFCVALQWLSQRLLPPPRRQFFLNGKTLPVERGGGVDQPGMRVAAAALGSGEWLHIFPEGRVTPDGSVGPFKQGIGRLVCDARAAAGGRCGILSTQRKDTAAGIHSLPPHS